MTTTQTHTFNPGDHVAYKELPGYKGEFLRYERSRPLMGGDCVVRWYKMEGRGTGPVESSEWSGNLKKAEV